MSHPTALSPRARSAWLALGRTLGALNEAGRSSPCQVDPQPFTSNSPSERRQAVVACRTACPALEACSRYADAQPEAWHVWAGDDRTPKGTPKAGRGETGPSWPESNLSVSVAT